MKPFISFLSLFAGLASSAHAAVDVPATDILGGRDARGAYQEVQIKPFEVGLDYFDHYDQDGLIDIGQSQIQYGIFPSDTGCSKTWSYGRRVELLMQDGQLKTLMRRSLKYQKIDVNRPYLTLTASLSYRDRAQAEQRRFTVQGVLTLTTSSVSAHRDSNGQWLTEIALWNDRSELLPADGSTDRGAFNDYGNGERDCGVIKRVAGTKTDGSFFTVGDLEGILGSSVSTTYP